MRKFTVAKTSFILFLFCAVTAILSSAQTLTTLVNFAGSNGGNPVAPVIQASDTNFYGTTNLGGANLAGTVFKMTPAGTLTTLYSFCSQGQNCTDGLNPSAGLMQATDGNLYGTTSDGGAHGAGGTVFKITLSGSLTTIYSFCAVSQCADGQGPNSTLVQGVDGNFYGTTRTDGVTHAGTVFKLTPSGTLTTLYHFCSQSNCTDGATPNQILQLASDGNFYGTTLYGGANGQYGTVFKVTPSGALTTLYSFCQQTNCADGDQPYAGLALGADGNFYGTTSLGGANSAGTVFKMTTGGSYTFLHSFNPGTDGTESHGALVQTLNGDFYGTTRLAGPHADGTIFQVTPTGTFTTLYTFCAQSGCPDGSNPFAGLIATRGNFYGTTSSGGSAGNGTVFSLSAPRSAPVQLVPMTPCRLVDTRSGGGNPIQGGTFQTFNVPQLAQSACSDILSSPAAFSLNVTLVPIDGAPVSYLTIWPAGQNQPAVSTMNSLDGRIKANAAIVPAGTNGGVNIYVTNTTNIVLDIDGYFAPAGSSTLQFYPLTPCRVADTRSSNYPSGLGLPHLSEGVQRDFPIPASTCIPQGVTPVAYSFNFTAIPYPSLGNPLGYLEVWPTGAQPASPVSTLNNPTGTYVANAAIVPAGAGGEITTFVDNDTDLAIDIDGYFAAPASGGLSLYTTLPCRVIDTRKIGSGQPFTGTLAPPVDVVDSACDVSSAAAAYVFNATVVPSPSLSYLTIWPDGENQPVVSTLNAADGWIASNMAIVPSVNGSVDAYAAGMTQLILDISAYFAP